MVKHTGKKPFKCELCSIRFTQKSNMKHHMKRSHGYGELMAGGWAWQCCHWDVCSQAGPSQWSCRMSAPPRLSVETRIFAYICVREEESLPSHSPTDIYSGVLAASVSMETELHFWRHMKCLGAEKNVEIKMNSECLFNMPGFVQLRGTWLPGKLFFPRWGRSRGVRSHTRSLMNVFVKWLKHGVR